MLQLCVQIWHLGPVHNLFCASVLLESCASRAHNAPPACNYLFASPGPPYTSVELPAKLLLCSYPSLCFSLCTPGLLEQIVLQDAFGVPFCFGWDKEYSVTHLGYVMPCEEGRQWITFCSYVMGTGSIRNYFRILHQVGKSRRTYSFGPDFTSVMFLTLFVTHNMFPYSLLFPFSYTSSSWYWDKPGFPLKDGDSWGMVTDSSALPSQPTCGRSGACRRIGTLQHSLCLDLEKHNVNQIQKQMNLHSRRNCNWKKRPFLSWQEC